MKRFFLVLFFVQIISFVFCEEERGIFIDKIFIELSGMEKIGELYGDIDTFKSKFHNGLIASFADIERLDSNFKLKSDKSESNFMINSKVTLEGDNLKFIITKTDKNGKIIDSEKIFLIDIYGDRDKNLSDIEYNAKALLYEIFGIYWLEIVRGDGKGLAPVVINDLLKQLNQEILKTKKGLIFDREKNKKIAEALTENDCITVECIQQIAPFLYIMKVDIEKNENSNNININIDLSKGGTSFKVTKFSFPQSEYENAFNQGKIVDKITDAAFDIMNVYNVDYFNEKLSEIKKIASEKAEFKLAKTKLDDLEKKFKKDEFNGIIKDYSSFLINAENKMFSVKKNNPLPVFPAVFGTLSISTLVTAGIFTYFYTDEANKTLKLYSKYENSIDVNEVNSSKKEYYESINKQKTDLAVFATMYSVGGLFLIIGIIGLSAQVATIENTKKELKNKVNKLSFFKKVSFDINSDFKENIGFSFTYKLD